MARSGSLAGCPFSTFSSSDRCGCIAASASLILPSSTRDCTQLWSWVSRSRWPSRKQVGAAVADVGQAELAAVEHRPGDGRAHALQGGVGLDQVRDPVVGLVDRARPAPRASPRRSVGRRSAGWCRWRQPRQDRRPRRHPCRRPPPADAGWRNRSPGCSCGSARSRNGSRTAAGASSAHGSSLKMVLPMRTVSASVIVVGAVIRWPLT